MNSPVSFIQSDEDYSSEEDNYHEQETSFDIIIDPERLFHLKEIIRHHCINLT